ncbi:MAG: Ig-like domain-containing protein, partial [Gemmataceae bacterium]|nr:Ig-like domain-containing protein [Gemmataceae bacterium]
MWRRWLRAVSRQLLGRGGRRRRKRRIPLQVEELERRELLALTASYQAGLLRIVSDGADAIQLGVNAGQEVTVNGVVVAAPGGNVRADQVVALQVVGGPGNNEIDISRLNPVQFVGLTTIEVDGGAGDDLLVGSGFSETLIGGPGNDVLRGGGGRDVLIDQSGSVSAHPLQWRSSIEWTDGDGDAVSLRYRGPGLVRVSDEDGDGRREVEVTGGDAGQSSLHVGVRAAAAGDGLVQLDAIRADKLRGLTARLATVVGPGVRIGGTAEQNTRLELYALADGASLESASGISELTVAAVGAGEVRAPRLGRVRVTGDRHRGLAGDWSADLTLSGEGLADGDALERMTVRGTVRGMTARIEGNVGALRVGRLVESTIAAGYTPADPSQPLLGGTFTVPAEVRWVRVNGAGEADAAAWVASTVAATEVGVVTIASVEPNNGGVVFGILGDREVGPVRVGQPAFVFRPEDPTPQGVGDFQVRRGAVRVTATLANDTARDGLTNADGITRDPALVGTVTNVVDWQQLRLRFSDRPDQVFDVSADVGAHGGFLLNRARLEALRGGPLPDGAYTVSFQVVDQGGNASALVPVSFVLDTTPPGPPANLRLAGGSDTGFSATDGITSVTTPTFTAQAEAEALVRLFRAGQLVGEATANNTVQITVTGPLADGPHEFTATATDVAGNESAAATVAITVDTEAPTLELHSPVSGGAYSGTLRVIGDSGDGGSGLHQVRVLVHGTESMLATPDSSGRFDVRAASQALAPGTHPIVVQTIDRAGNVRQVQRTVTVSNAFFIGAAGT